MFDFSFVTICSATGQHRSTTWAGSLHHFMHCTIWSKIADLSNFNLSSFCKYYMFEIALLGIFNMFVLYLNSCAVSIGECTLE
jgi:hypothetical protein